MSEEDKFENIEIKEEEEIIDSKIEMVNLYNENNEIDEEKVKSNIKIEKDVLQEEIRKFEKSEDRIVDDFEIFRHQMSIINNRENGKEIKINRLCNLDKNKINFNSSLIPDNYEKWTFLERGICFSERFNRLIDDLIEKFSWKYKPYIPKKKHRNVFDALLDKIENDRNLIQFKRRFKRRIKSNIKEEMNKLKEFDKTISSL